jgi:hypothetical protein
MASPERPSLCRAEGGAARDLSGVLLSHPQGAVQTKTTGGNTGNTGNLGSKPPEDLFGNDIKELKRHGSTSRRLPETWRKPAETGGNPL